MSSNVQNRSSLMGYWSLLAPYAIQPLAASCAIVPAYRDLVAKSALQRGESVQYMSAREWIKGGSKMAPTIGGIIGVQMCLQTVLEKAITGDSNEESLSSKFVSSAVIGTLSSPLLAAYNAQTIKMGAWIAFRNVTKKQCLVISLQETAFVGGISVAGKLAEVMKEKLGHNKAVEYVATFTAGALGSLAGHPANTALTRWQSGMTVETVRQSMWGAFRKARAIGTFAVFYKMGKELLNPLVERSQ